MYGQYPYGAGPFMMAQQPPQPQVIYVPVSSPGMSPSSQPPMPPMRNKFGKPMSMKRMLKVKAAVEKAIEESKKLEPKKEDKPKKLKDKTFSWLELWAMLITWSLPVAVLVLGGVKAFTVLVKSLM